MWKHAELLLFADDNTIYATCPEKTRGMESLWNIGGDGELVSYVPEKNDWHVSGGIVI